MSIELVFAGEVKVNIRLFIAVEAQESLKRNIIAVTYHFLPANRAVFIFKIKAV